MRIFKTKYFARVTRRFGIIDEALCKAVSDISAEQSALSLAKFLYKVRIARLNEGKSGGYRAIVVLTDGELCVFVHAFAKSSAENLTDPELAMYRKLAKHIGDMKADKVDELIADGEWIGVSRAKTEA